MAFVASTSLVLGGGAAVSGAVCNRGISNVRTVRAPRRARMCAEGGDKAGESGTADKKDKGDTLPGAGARSAAQIAEDSVKQTWQGNAWFAVITVGMALGMAATLARDFVPGGGPASL